MWLVLKVHIQPADSCWSLGERRSCHTGSEERECQTPAQFFQRAQISKLRVCMYVHMCKTLSCVYPYVHTWLIHMLCICLKIWSC